MDGNRTPLNGRRLKMYILSMTVMQAQNNDKLERKAPKEITPEMKVERMAKELSLTDEQKAKVLNLNKEYEKQMKSILSDDQYTKYEKM